MVNAARTIAELRELSALTSDARGAQRVAWTPVWTTARSWLKAKLEDLPVEVETDAAGNLWATLPGPPGRSLVIGSHLDSVPDGGWLDGCLGVVAGLEVLRDIAGGGGPPAATVKLVDWADEEGARFGRSLFGSSAACGTLDLERVAKLVDSSGILISDALGIHGLRLATVMEKRSMLEGVSAYLELHIEQGAELERLGRPLGVVTGTLGVSRHALRFTGLSNHAGSPMEGRRDPLLAAASAVVAVRDLAARLRGLATVGRLDCSPGIPTAVPAEATILLDLRHEHGPGLAELLQATREASQSIAARHSVTVEWREIFASPPAAFDPDLMERAEAAITEIAGAAPRMPSGRLHDATQLALAGVPVAMIFVRSIGGVSHSAAEDTSEPDLEVAITALGVLAERSLARLADYDRLRR